jgi:hypothetical protein
MRGLAASARIQGQYKSAIKHLERVLEISQEFKEFTGDYAPSRLRCSEDFTLSTMMCNLLTKECSLFLSIGYDPLCSV